MARPKDFDRNAALVAAMKNFWAKGYEGTSIADLTEAMGISRSSMYETFGDKNELFLEALRFYLELTAQKRAAILMNAKSVKQGMADFLQGVIHFTLDEENPGGCFFTNTATALGTLNDDIQTEIKRGLDRMEQDFYIFLENDRLRGNLPETRDCRALARFFVGCVRGMSVVARITKDRKVLEDMSAVALEALS